MGIPDTIRTNVLSPGFSVTASGSATCATPGLPVQLNTTVTGTSIGLKYNWSLNTSTLSATNIPNPIATPTALSSYYVQVSDTNGCTAGDTLTLLTGSYHVNAGPDRTTCLHTSVNLSASVSPASSAYTYNWIPAAGTVSRATISNPSYSSYGVGTQRLLLRVDSAACSVFDTLFVRTLPDTFTVSNATACAGQTVTLAAIGDTNFTYSWTPSTRLTFASPATTYSDQHPDFLADTTTMFTITAQYPGCPNMVNHLQVSVQPVPVITLPDTVYTTSASPAAISTSVFPAWFPSYNYAWSYSSYIDSPASPNINFSGPNDTTLYLTVNTQYGCVAHDSVHVIVSNMSAMRVANAFVPGSANNGTFRVLHLEQGFTFRYMRIYDRWGRQLFQTNNVGQGWDGTYQGRGSNTGAYVYVLEAEAADGRTVVQKGTVTLLR
jgi:gliding motility-associated-like protein